MSLLGRNRLPDDGARAVFAGAPLMPGERVLQWGVAGDGWVVATNIGLRWPAAYELVRWDLIDHVTYVDRAMRVEPGDVILRFENERRLPEVVKDRVNASIALDRHLRLISDGRGLRVIGRRRSDTGELRWETSYDDGIDAADPVIAARAAAAVGEVRSLFA